MIEVKSTRVLTALLALAATPLALTAQASGSYSLTGSEVAIYNLAGEVEIVAGSGSSVGVEIQADGDDASELYVETGPIDGWETLRVIYPSDRIVYRDLNRGSRTNIRVRDDGTFMGRGNRGERVTVSSSGRGLEAWADMTISVPRGQHVRVLLGIGEVMASNVDGTLEINVAAAPVRTRGTSGTLDIGTGSGSIDVDGARGAVELSTGSGSIDVANVTGDDVRVTTGSGSIEGAGLQARSLHVQTGSGRIDLGEAAFTEGTVRTGSGRIVLDLMTDVDDLNVRTGSGGVTVYFDEQLGAELDLDTGSGSIDFDVPITVRRFTRRSLTGSIGDGVGSIRIDTGSGSIRFVER